MEGRACESDWPSQSPHHLAFGHLLPRGGEGNRFRVFCVFRGPTPLGQAAVWSELELHIAQTGGDFVDHPILVGFVAGGEGCLLYTSPSPRDGLLSRMPSSA